MNRQSRCIAPVMCLLAVALAWTPRAAWSYDLRAASAVYLFDDGDGAVAKDTSNNGNDGELIGGPVWVDGMFGGALEFSGAGTLVNVEHPVGLPVVWAPRTIALWFKWAEVLWPQWGIELMGQGPHLAGQRLGIWMDSERGVGVEIGGVPLGPSWLIEWEGDTDWHHLAVSVPDGDRTKSNVLKLYLDGQLRQGVDFGRKPTILNTAASPLVIGRMSGFEGFNFKGIIDEVAIFPWELSATEIAAIATTGLEQAQAVSPSGKLATSWGILKAR